MRRTARVAAVLAAVLVAKWVQAAEAAELPKSIVADSGSRVGAYIFFALAAGVAVLLIHRGVRAR